MGLEASGPGANFAIGAALALRRAEDLSYKFFARFCERTLCLRP